MTAADDPEAAKALLHEAFHSLNPRISGLEAGECHCNLLAEVGLDALNFGAALAAAEARGVERGRTEAAEAIARLEAERDEARADSERWREEDRRLVDAANADWDRSRAALVDRGKALAQYQLACGQHQAAAFAAQAERDAMRPVVERLRTIKRVYGDVSAMEPGDAWRELGELVAAVDQTAPSSPLATPHTADDGEAGVVEGAGGSEAAEAIRAQADHPCRCGHLRGHHTWRGRACQMCYGCPAFEEVLTDG